jgi:tRNA U38,U39,U40 pseudouridine synthase TruA
MVGAAVHCAQGRERAARVLQDLRQPSEEANLYWGANAAPAAGLFLEQVRYPGDPEPDPIRALVPVY